MFGSRVVDEDDEEGTGGCSAQPPMPPALFEGSLLVGAAAPVAACKPRARLGLGLGLRRADAALPPSPGCMLSLLAPPPPACQAHTLAHRGACGAWRRAACCAAPRSR